MPNFSHLLKDEQKDCEIPQWSRASEYVKDMKDLDQLLLSN